MMITFVEENLPPLRLDIYLNEKFSEWSRSHIQKLISDGLITVDDVQVKASFKLTGGDLLLKSRQTAGAPCNVTITLRSLVNEFVRRRKFTAAKVGYLS